LRFDLFINLVLDLLSAQISRNLPCTFALSYGRDFNRLYPYALHKDSVLQVFDHLGVDGAKTVGAIEPFFLVFIGFLVVTFPYPSAL
jgi:hypothetical protein